MEGIQGVFAVAGGKGRYNEAMTITLDKLPVEATEALRKQAEREGRSLQEVATEVLLRALGIDGAGIKRDLSDVVGTWVDDPAFDEAMKDFEQIDPEKWK
jgi:hypothetical protein